MDAESARALVRALRTGTLATIAREPAGFPYGSLVAYALDSSDVVLLLSELAEHTKNLRGDDRASLLVAEPAGEGDPLAGARVTLLGRCSPADSVERARSAYLARHPHAASYAGFKDFAFWILRVESARYVGGFGTMSWISRNEWAGPRRNEP